MKKVAVLLLILSLAGCAQWDQMTPQERRVVIGTGVAAALIAGAVVAHNQDDSAPASEWKPWEYRPVLCKKHCK